MDHPPSKKVKASVEGGGRQKCNHCVECSATGTATSFLGFDRTRTKKLFKELHKSTQYKTMKERKKSVFNIFDENKMSPQHSLALLRNIEKELGFVEDQASVDFSEAVEAQYMSLDQPGKRALISHLTHRDGALNEDILECVPSKSCKKRKVG